MGKGALPRAAFLRRGACAGAGAPASQRPWTLLHCLRRCVFAGWRGWRPSPARLFLPTAQVFSCCLSSAWRRQRGAALTESRFAVCRSALLSPSARVFGDGPAADSPSSASSAHEVRPSAFPSVSFVAGISRQMHCPRRQCLARRRVFSAASEAMRMRRACLFAAAPDWPR